jgi:DEAD/DEAH box helicase domain-containing protein
MLQILTMSSGSVTADLKANCPDRSDIWKLTADVYRIYLYETHKEGMAAAVALYNDIDTVLQLAKERMIGCSCNDGCPRCVHNNSCPHYNTLLSRIMAIRVLEAAGL